LDELITSRNIYVRIYLANDPTRIEKEIKNGKEEPVSGR
jgi:hypothetical protein